MFFAGGVRGGHAAIESARTGAIRQRSDSGRRPARIQMPVGRDARSHYVHDEGIAFGKQNPSAQPDHHTQKHRGSACMSLSASAEALRMFSQAVRATNFSTYSTFLHICDIFTCANVSEWDKTHVSHFAFANNSLPIRLMTF